MTLFLTVYLKNFDNNFQDKVSSITLLFIAYKYYIYCIQSPKYLICGFSWWQIFDLKALMRLLLNIEHRISELNKRGSMYPDDSINYSRHEDWVFYLTAWPRLWWAPQFNLIYYKLMMQDLQKLDWEHLWACKIISLKA